MLVSQRIWCCLGIVEITADRRLYTCCCLSWWLVFSEDKVHHVLHFCKNSGELTYHVSQELLHLPLGSHESLYVACLWTCSSLYCIDIRIETKRV